MALKQSFRYDSLKGRQSLNMPNTIVSNNNILNCVADPCHEDSLTLKVIQVCFLFGLWIDYAKSI